MGDSYEVLNKIIGNPLAPTMIIIFFAFTSPPNANLVTATPDMALPANEPIVGLKAGSTKGQRFPDHPMELIYISLYKRKLFRSP